MNAIVQGTQLDAHQMPKLGVERPQGLVHHEGLGPPHDGSAERDTLTVASGEPRHRPIDQVLDAQELSHFVHALPDFSARHGLTLQREADVAAHVHVRIQREELEHETDVALRCAFERHVLAVEQDFARRRQFQPGDHAQRGRLAATGRPQQHEEISVGDGERGRAHGGEIAEALLQILQSYLGHDPSPGNDWSRGSPACRPGSP